MPGNGLATEELSQAEVMPARNCGSCGAGAVPECQWSSCRQQLWPLPFAQLLVAHSYNPRKTKPPVLHPESTVPAAGKGGGEAWAQQVNKASQMPSSAAELAAAQRKALRRQKLADTGSEVR